MAYLGVEQAQGLSGDRLAAIASLERRVVDHDGGRLKLEWGVLGQRAPDAVNDLLAWDGEVLAGFCGIYTFGRMPEVAIAVDPAHRRRGIGTALLDGALELLRERGVGEMLLVTPRATAAGRAFAEGRGAVFDHAEHHMELDGEPDGPPPERPATAGLSLRGATESDLASVAGILEDGFGVGLGGLAAVDSDELALVVEVGGAVVGTLRIDMEDGSAGIYGLAVRSDLRGQGIGRAVLYQACLEVRRRGARKVTLEVEIDNDRALGLYTSVGFERRTTEDYFRLAV